MREKIVLIDGHSILNRAFYGVPDLTNSEGLHTNAVYGFLNIMFKVLDEEKPEYLTVTFDVHAPTFRHKMFADYKGTRKPMAEELRQQVPVIKDVLKAMNIEIIEKEGLEADDLLGTISCMCEEKGMDVSIISGDRDTLQLATEHVKIRIPKTKQGRTEVEDYNASDVIEKYGVTPKEFIDVKALMGDASDNIPGVPGVGEKTATKIIQQYKSIENAYEHVDELKPPRASRNLKEFWEQAEMSKTLATIETHAEIEFDVEKAHLGDLYTKEAHDLFQRLQFKNLLGRFDVGVSANEVEKKFREVTEREEIERVFEEAMHAESVGAAFSKDQGNVLPLFAHPSGFGRIAVAFGEDRIYSIPCDMDTDMEYLFGGLSKIAGADLARLDGARPAAADGDGRRRVVGRTEGAGSDDPLLPQNARNGVDLGDLERLFKGHGGHDAGDAAGEHGFARAGRTDEQKVVVAADGHFERALGDRLPLTKARSNFSRRAATAAP